jgi:hypothetical protein
MFRLYLDSQHRVSGKPYTARYSFSDINSDYLEFSVEMESIIFYNTVYPVNSTNNVIVFGENAGANTGLTFTIPSGQYTGTQIATQIQSGLNDNTANAYTYTCAFSSTTNKLTITSNIGETFALTSIDQSVYGFVPSSTYRSGSYEATYHVQLSGESYIDVQTNFNTDELNSNVSSFNIMERVPLYTSYGGLVVHRNMESHSHIVSNRNNFDNIVVSLLRADGEYYELSDTTNVSVVLRCTPIANSY